MDFGVLIKTFILAESPELLILHERRALARRNLLVDLRLAALLVRVAVVPAG